MAEVVDCLPSKCETLGVNSQNQPSLAFPQKKIDINEVLTAYGF
jgi:hypothetical protein